MYTVVAGAERLDRELILHWLSEQSYWARGRTREALDAAIAGSRTYGVYTEDGQVAFARVVTDGATFAWICDVFVAEEVRGRGIGTMLMTGILDDLAPLKLKRTTLATADAHGLYERFGFTPLPDPAMWMAL